MLMYGIVYVKQFFFLRWCIIGRIFGRVDSVRFIKSQKDNSETCIFEFYIFDQTDHIKVSIWGNNAKMYSNMIHNFLNMNHT